MHCLPYTADSDFFSHIPLQYEGKFLFAKSGYNCGCVPTYKPYLHASKPSPESLLQYSETPVLFGRTFAVPLTHIPISNTTRSTASLLSAFMLLTYVTSATKVYAQIANNCDPQMTVVSRALSHYPPLRLKTNTLHVDVLDESAVPFK